MLDRYLDELSTRCCGSAAHTRQRHVSHRHANNRCYWSRLKYSRSGPVSSSPDTNLKLGHRILADSFQLSTAARSTESQQYVCVLSSPN